MHAHYVKFEPGVLLYECDYHVTTYSESFIFVATGLGSFLYSISLFMLKKHFTSCTIMRRQSASVIKMGVHVGNEAFKRRLAYSVTVRVLAFCLSQKHC